MFQKERTGLAQESFIDLKYITNESRVTAKYFYSIIKRGEFPAPIKLSRRPRWLLKDYSEWRARHTERRDARQRLK